MAKRDYDKEIAALMKEKEAADAAGDDYEIHITSGDKGAKLPASKANKWLYDNFGIGDAPDADGEDDDGQEEEEEEQEDPPARQSVWGRK